MGTAATTQHKILVVDDETAVLFAVQQYFTQIGYEVDCAANSLDAKALLHAVCPALLLADLCLIGGSDTEGLALIRYARERYPGIRVILMTAHGSPEIERDARACGVDAVLGKPIRLRALDQVVSRLLGNAT